MAIAAAMYPRRAPTLLAGLDERLGRVRSVVAMSAGLELMGSVAHAASCVSRALEIQPRLIVIDEQIPGGAIAATAEITARLPELRVVILHATTRPTAFVEAVAAGACAYVDHAATHERLVEVFSAAAAGAFLFSQEQIALLVQAVGDRPRFRRRLASEPALTAREWQIYELMRELSNAEIAERLTLSPVTVRSHKRAIRSKLGTAVRNPVHR